MIVPAETKLGSMHSVTFCLSMSSVLFPFEDLGFSIHIEPVLPHMSFLDINDEPPHLPYLLQIFYLK